MLIDNKIILRDKNVVLLEKLQTVASTIEIIDTKSGDKTFNVKFNEQMISYHSRYNPKQEAKTLVAQKIQKEVKYFLLIGVGLGYVLEEIIEKYPDAKVSIYEPNIGVMATFLNHFNLQKIKSKNIDLIFTDLNELNNPEYLFKQLEDNKSEMVISTIADRLYVKEIEAINQSLKNYLSAQKNQIVTDLRYQSRWTINSIVNLNEVLSSPNLFEHIAIEKFKGKPVLIVAAGPALDDEIENIRYIKENKKAYILAVGSAVNTLIYNDILPDALFSYDPQAFNANVTKNIKELNLQIPLVFGTSVGYETLVDYPGDKIHFFTNQDSISTNLVKNNSIIVPDAPTIAAITLFVVSQLQMGPILLVGQNLSITKEKAYAEGIEYYSNKSEDFAQNRNEHQSALSTTGEEIYTNDSYLEMKNAIESIIRLFNLNGRIYNTTQNGLPITGAKFESLKTIIETVLVENNIIDDKPFEAVSSYDLHEAITNFKQLENSFDEMIGYFKKVVEIDTKIQNDYNKKILGNIGNLFNQFDIYFQELERNQFFRSVIAPSTRVQYSELIERSKKIPFEKRPLQKMKLYIDIYSKYIRTIYVTIYGIQSAFKILKDGEFGGKLNSIK